MAAKMMLRSAAGLVAIAAMPAVWAQAQQWYLGPGVVVQSQVYGPFVQPVNPYAGPGPYFYPTLPVPPTYVAAPGPYLYGPVIVPPAYGYWPSPYWPGTSGPLPQSYQGYQPKGDPPHFAGPYASAPEQSQTASLQDTKAQARAGRAPAQPTPPPANAIKLEKIRMRDPCILADTASKTYYLVGSAGRSVRAYTSTDLATWQGPQIVFTTPEDLWGDILIVGIWAPELHAYQGKYYLFLTFDTRHQFAEQWRNWLPRVTRGSQVLVADAPGGPFKSFQNRSTLPPDMMTLDGTLWVEDGVPCMVFCHEWVQIKDGTVEYIRLKNDLSGTVGEPTRLFDGSDAAWSQKSLQYGCHVTDAPFLYKGKTGKLYLIWASGGKTGYTEGIAISASGKLAGPWTQQTEPLYANDGGHGMLFTTFDAKLMMVLHAPNGRDARPHLFEMEDTGETLKIIKEL
jgi:arabinan endo-1,5-alpha-L-arabinosidase